MNTRTGTITTLTEDFQSLQTLLGATAHTDHYEDVLLENTGDTPLLVCATANAGTPTDAQSKTIAPAGFLALAKAQLRAVFARTTDDAGDNILEFVGTPKG